MAAVALTDVFIRIVNGPQHGRAELADARCRGLYLRVTASGVRSWSFRFRSPLTGTASRLTLGKYPDLSLAAARAIADQERAKVVRGLDPIVSKKSSRHERSRRPSVSALIDKFIEEYAKPNKRSWRNDRHYLRAAKVAWGSRQAADVSRRDILELLRQIAATAPITSNRTRSALSKLFNWAVDEELLAVS